VTPRFIVGCHDAVYRDREILDRGPGQDLPAGSLDHIRASEGV
jgi:hypothetical protein